MNNLVGNIKSLVIIALVIVIVFMRFCSGTGKPCPEIVKETVDTAYLYEQWAGQWTKPKPDTIIKSVYLPGKPHAPDTIFRVKDTIKWNWVVDTAAILKDYFAKVVYNDTLRHEYGYVAIKDTISENRIQARQPVFNFHVPVVTITKTVEEEPHAKVFIGPDVFFNRKFFSGAGGSLDLFTKKDKHIGIGGGLQSMEFKLPSGEVISHTDWYGKVSMKFKLSFRK